MKILYLWNHPRAKWLLLLETVMGPELSPHGDKTSTLRRSPWTKHLTRCECVYGEYVCVAEKEEKTHFCQQDFRTVVK